MNAVITGASRGIGRAIAIRFAKKGFDLALCARSATGLDKLRKELSSKFGGIRMLCVPVDVSDKIAIREFGALVRKEWKRVDVLVNNAGFYEQGPVHSEPDGLLEKMIATNLFGAYHLTRAILPAMMKRRSGHVFNICSVASIKPYVDGGAYCISKHALYGFSRVLREEMKEYRIRVTSVLPGATWTGSWSGTKESEGRFIRPEDLADLVWNAYAVSPRTVVEEILVRPVMGDI